MLPTAKEFVVLQESKRCTELLHDALAHFGDEPATIIRQYLKNVPTIPHTLFYTRPQRVASCFSIAVWLSPNNCVDAATKRETYNKHLWVRSRLRKLCEPIATGSTERIYARSNVSTRDVP
jgi:hypothetical protein